MKLREKCPNPSSSPTARYCAECRREIAVIQGRKQGKRRSRTGPNFYVEPRHARDD